MMLSDYNKKVLEKIDRIARNLPPSQLVELQEFGFPVTVKLESQNPTGCIKDKTALYMIRRLAEKNILRKDSILCDASSGSFAVSLSWLASELDLESLLLMPESANPRKVQAVRDFGGQIVFLGNGEGSTSFQEASANINATPHVVRLDQMNDSCNAQAHYEMTGPEILEGTGGSFSHLFAGIGTGGTLCGSSRFLKERNLSLVTVGVDHCKSIYYKSFHKLSVEDLNYADLGVEGVGDIESSGIFSWQEVDEVMGVSNEEARQQWMHLVNERGIDAGPSSGLVFAGFLQYLKKNKSPQAVVMIFPDGTRFYGN